MFWAKFNNIYSTTCLQINKTCTFAPHMIKAFAQYLIIPCILLLGGYGQLLAHTDKESATSYSFLHIDELAKFQPTSVQHLPDFSIHAAKSGSERGERRQTISVFECAEELDARVSFKRHSNRNFNSITLYNGQELCFNFHPNEKHSHAHGYNHLISPTYQSHLLFQVFRI